MESIKNWTSKITGYDRPKYFADEMIKGAFAEFKHEHHLKNQMEELLMTDFFDYKSPLGFFGKLADKIFLKRYMIELLIERNQIIKEFAESDKWKEIINE